MKLSDALRERTRAVHLQAERSGVVRTLLKGCASRRDYAVLLRNLLPVYSAMESELEAHGGEPAVRALPMAALARCARLAADLVALAGPDAAERFPLMPATRRYVERLREIARSKPSLLAAHAYVRYFGDLSGGAILKSLLARNLALEPHMLTFYDFPRIDDASAFRQKMRDHLDADVKAHEIEAMSAEAVVAFELNVEVSCEIQDYVGQLAD